MRTFGDRIIIKYEQEVYTFHVVRAVSGNAYIMVQCLDSNDKQLFYIPVNVKADVTDEGLVELLDSYFNYVADLEPEDPCYE